MSVIALIIPICILLAVLFIGVVIALVMYSTRRNARNSQTVSAPPVAAQDKAPKPLCEILKEYRIRHNMTQEFIAEQLDVSRQAVSKWENGTSDPSTSNLIALAKLYGVSVDEMLKAVQ